MYVSESDSRAKLSAENKALAKAQKPSRNRCFGPKTLVDRPLMGGLSLQILSHMGGL